MGFPLRLEAVRLLAHRSGAAAPSANVSFKKKKLYKNVPARVPSGVYFSGAWKKSDIGGEPQSVCDSLSPEELKLTALAADN